MVKGIIVPTVNAPRSRTFWIAVMTKIMSLGPVYHQLVGPTQTSQAVPMGWKFDSMLDFYVLGANPNLIALITALNELMFRYGWYMVLILVWMTTFYLLLKKWEALARIRMSEKFVSVKNNNDTRMWDSMNGWMTVFIYSQVPRETVSFAAGTDYWVKLKTSRAATTYLFMPDRPPWATTQL
ncbi:hypothetical protein AYL99_11806 [Fonsecaea erecta]|uniref:Uncharacterized protein n=1 Tax=Fonsecaea erecta TaxID=1367422 RepID=A0A178Z3K8_9EURO|nr:hypothetical protein AYL99_11806 [Fonsecaea erecta]OAP54046.1 hypothetical protein AYL99_11806 [Fonsecaea erecta]